MSITKFKFWFKNYRQTTFGVQVLIDRKRTNRNLIKTKNNRLTECSGSHDGFLGENSGNAALVTPLIS